MGRAWSPETPPTSLKFPPTALPPLPKPPKIPNIPLNPISTLKIPQSH